MHSPMTDTRRPNAHNLKGEEEKAIIEYQVLTNRTKPHTKTNKAKKAT
ncbi:hypothetical protein EDF68_102530 [Ochrobactrum sp. BH3]|nr:hypothetical protein EDF68_102530 [Ochrobactrum sp. BH3]